jgi:transposase
MNDPPIIKPKKRFKLQTFSWFDCNFTNIAPNIPSSKYTVGVPFIRTYKILLYPNAYQLNIIKLWLNDAIDVYNFTVDYVNNIILPSIDKMIINFVPIRKYRKIHNQILSYGYKIKATDNLIDIDNFNELIEPLQKELDKLKPFYDTAIKNNNIEFKIISRTINFIDARKILSNKIDDVLLVNNADRHMLDASVHHCISMFKSAFTNFLRGNIPKFKLKHLSKTKNTKQLFIEPVSFSTKKNSFFSRKLGPEIKSSRNLQDFKSKTCTLQYNRDKNVMILLCPVEIVPCVAKPIIYIPKTYSQKLNEEQLKPSSEKPETKKQPRKRKSNRYPEEAVYMKTAKCGIDMGMRTFLSCYDGQRTFDICNSNVSYPIIIDFIERRTRLKEYMLKGEMSKNRYKKLRNKLQKKMRDKIDDMHNKSASFLTKRYEKINVGIVSVKAIMSNNGNMTKLNKQICAVLSLYRFRKKLENYGEKRGCEVNAVSEYMTSKTCSSCGKINDVKDSKVYKCSGCKLEIDRDTNAAKNIWKK